MPENFGWDRRTATKKFSVSNQPETKSKVKTLETSKSACSSGHYSVKMPIFPCAMREQLFTRDIHSTYILEMHGQIRSRETVYL